MNAVISTVGACLLTVRQASFRRHELYPGLIMELGNLDIDDGCGKLPMQDSLAAKGKCAIPLKRERHNTNVMFRGGLIRSSDEGSVMGLERRD